MVNQVKNPVLVMDSETGDTSDSSSLQTIAASLGSSTRLEENNSGPLCQLIDTHVGWMEVME